MPIVTTLEQCEAQTSSPISARALSRSTMPGLPRLMTTTFLWCPVVGGYEAQSRVHAAHIFPYFLGSRVMKRVFGEGAPDETFSTRNGLLLWDEIENEFDKHKLVIVPAPYRARPAHAGAIAGPVAPGLVGQDPRRGSNAQALRHRRGTEEKNRA